MPAHAGFFPGGRPRRGSPLYVGVAAATIVPASTQLDALAHLFPKMTVRGLQGVLVALGLLVVGLGWVVLKLLGIPFARDKKQA